MSIDLVLCGATGRLGKEILIEVGKQSNINLIGCVASKNNKNFGKKIATFIESNCELELKDSFEEIAKPDVVIDVSSPEAFEDIVKFSELNKSALIIASTGHSNEQIESLKRLSNSIPIMMVPNLSRGINFIKKLLSDNELSVFSKKVKINEIHHKNKKDSPSGTALELEKIIEEKNKEIEISINSTRDESSVGVHSIKIIMENESIELKHEAKSRDIFAQGAISAINWIAGKTPGIYSLSDL